MIMATCPKCGSTLVRFKNPDREICPTPERHSTTSTLGRSTKTGAWRGKNPPRKTKSGQETEKKYRKKK